MYEEFDLFTFLIGLPLGIIITGIVFMINRKIGKKKRWFDERYNRIHGRARSYSWVATNTEREEQNEKEQIGYRFLFGNCIWIHAIQWCSGCRCKKNYHKMCP